MLWALFCCALSGARTLSRWDGILDRMLNIPTCYLGVDTPVHRLDARVKIVLLLAFSITLFAVETWRALGILASALAVVWAASRIPFGMGARMLMPLYVILACTVAFNSFTLDIEAPMLSYGVGSVSAGIFAQFAPIALVGDFGFVPEGFARGLFYAARIVLLALASLVLSFSTSSYDLMEAVRSLLSPLRRFNVPVDDAATVFSLALRFIPVLAEELSSIHSAQWSRGARFEEGGIRGRLIAWGRALIPLFVGLFRRADRLAVAMESRCYGAGSERTCLNVRRFGPKETVVTCAGVAACVLVAFAC